MMNSFDADGLGIDWASRLGATRPRWAADRGAPGPNTRPAPPTIDGVTGEPDPAPGPARAAGPAPQSRPAPDWLQLIPAELRGLVASHLPPGLPDTLGPGFTRPTRTPAAGASLPEGAQCLARTFANPAGTRPYKLFVPSGYRGQPVPLVIMLHGCTQSPDDFATGTRMNEAAEQQTILVAYPGQTAAGNAQKCWNWFSPDDQLRGAGEPSIIAGITRQIMQDYAVDRRRVYVAGLSAGGAAASVMADTYPDLYAAIGVHSGLACGAARDLPSALAAMRGGGAARSAGAAGRRHVPAIIFHGDRDTTVNPRNADAVAGQSAGEGNTRAQVQTGQTSGGRSYTRTIHLDGSGAPLSEQWLIHGAGHAWSGGSPAGSYTDPLGPNATHEMLRFFGEHPHAGPAPG